MLVSAVLCVVEFRNYRASSQVDIAVCFAERRHMA